MIAGVFTLLLAGAQVKSALDLGKLEGRCRPGERGPAFVVEVEGMNGRQGLLKLELYPANDADFLADDSVLVASGKAFGRVEIAVPQRGAVELCIRAPRPGSYALSLLHDRDSNHRFTLISDGVGFSGNPKLGLSKPRAAAVATRVGGKPLRLRIRMNYRGGLFSFAPVER